MKRQTSASARRDHVRQLVQGTVSSGAVLVLLVLYDRTGHGTHWSWCGRRHIGDVVGDLAKHGRPYSVRQVGRYLQELELGGWIVSRRRWNDTAVRRLSDRLLESLAKLAGKRWRRSSSTSAKPPRPAGADAVRVWELDDAGNLVRLERGPPAG